MPIGTRIRANNQFGTITNNPLAAGGGTLFSNELADFPEVTAGNHAVITLDPMKLNGDPEIVIITFHSAAATSAGITRGAYGTVARIHPQNTDWVHAPITEDVSDIVTSSTQPADPYEGQQIYETDTKFTKHYDGSDFNPISNIFQQDSEPPAVQDYIWVDTDESAGVGLSSILGYAEVTADQGGITNVETDLTDLSVNVTVPEGRRLRITGVINVRSTVADDEAQLRIQEDGANVQIAIQGLPRSNGNEFITASRVLSPSAGSHTYNLALVRGAGTGTLTMEAAATLPAYILVEDITGSLWPAGQSIGVGQIASEAWTDWVPTFTNFTLGSGVVVARYVRIGRTIHFRLQVTLSSSTMGTAPQFTLPVAVDTTGLTTNRNNIAWVALSDAGTAVFDGNGSYIATDSCRIHALAASGAHVSRVNVTASVPFTWVDGDEFSVHGTYEAAS